MCGLATILLLIYVTLKIQVFNSHSSTDQRLSDYCDGQQYKGCKLFCEDPCALQIQLYYDEVDVCNEIGSKSTVHKLGRSDTVLATFDIIFHLHVYKH